MAYLTTRFERPLEPREDKYIPMMTDEEEKNLLIAFCKEDPDEFVKFIDGLDSTILWDYAVQNRYDWQEYKEENRFYE